MAPRTPKISGMAQDLVRKLAGVADDRLQLPRQRLDIGHRGIDPLVQLGIVDQLAERTIRIVDRGAEGLQLGHDAIELLHRPIDGVDEFRPALAEGPGQPFHVLQISIGGLQRDLESVDGLATCHAGCRAGH